MQTGEGDESCSEVRFGRSHGFPIMAGVNFTDFWNKHWYIPCNSKATFIYWIWVIFTLVIYSMGEQTGSPFYINITNP